MIKFPRLHFPFPRHNHTLHVQFNTRQCQACGKCVKACPKHVLGTIAFLSHRHVHVEKANSCIGCNACIRACQHQAIQSRENLQ